MSERWVVNASPLIVLARINQQNLLPDLCEQLLLPDAVLNEINAGPDDDAARLYLATAPLNTLPVSIAPAVQAWDLGSGETAVLSYALANPGWRAVVDDGAARRCARALGIPSIGTLGIVLRARNAGLIPAAAPLLHELKANGFRLEDAVIRAALWQAVGEDWE